MHGCVSLKPDSVLTAFESGLFLAGGKVLVALVHSAETSVVSSPLNTGSAETVDVRMATATRASEVIFVATHKLEI